MDVSFLGSSYQRNYLLGSSEICECPVDEYLHRGPAGEPGGSSFAGTFERKEVYLGFFLGLRGH